MSPAGQAYAAPLGASPAFYCGLFGWEAETAPNAYLVYSLQGRADAGAGPLFDESQSSGQCAHIDVAQADDSAAVAAHAGAGVIVEPLDVPHTAASAF